MALNVPLTSGLDGEFPLPFPGEVFVLTRDKLKLHLTDAQLNLKSVKGRLFLTSMRLVFMPSVPAPTPSTDRIASVEIPWRGLWDERFHQPIFGVNNLTFSTEYYSDAPFTDTLSVRLDFMAGGVNTFLPIFNNILIATRTQMRAEQRGDEIVADPIPQPGAAAARPAEYYPGQSEAFVDPNDSSVLYTTQPATEEAPRSEMPRWSTGSQTLRKRR